MMSGVDNSRYMILKNKLGNRMLLGYDNYPKSRVGLLKVLNYYKEKGGNRG